VWPLVVVDAGEGVEEGLQLGEGGGLGVLGGEPVLEGLLEPFGLALGLGMTCLRHPPTVPARVFLCLATRHSYVLRLDT
jgi:hypothetical protein